MSNIFTNKYAKAFCLLHSNHVLNPILKKKKKTPNLWFRITTPWLGLSSLSGDSTSSYLLLLPPSYKEQDLHGNKFTCTTKYIIYFHEGGTHVIIQPHTWTIASRCNLLCLISASSSSSSKSKSSRLQKYNYFLYNIIKIRLHTEFYQMQFLV